MYNYNIEIRFFEQFYPIQSPARVCDRVKFARKLQDISQSTALYNRPLLAPAVLAVLPIVRNLSRSVCRRGLQDASNIIIHLKQRRQAVLHGSPVGSARRWQPVGSW